jgi:hypothetical protein
MAELIELAPGVYKKFDSMYKIKCIITGELVYINKLQIEELLTLHGSYEEIGRKYISRKGKSILKKQKLTTTSSYCSGGDIKLNQEPSDTLSEVQEDQLSSIDIPDMIFYGNRYSHYNLTASDKKIYKAVNADSTTCMHPYLFHKNNGYCNGCSWFEICQIGFKKIGTPRSIKRDDCLAKVTNHVEIYTEFESRNHNKI